MDYFNWRDELSVHNELIDHDHHTLIDMVNELHRAVEMGNGYLILSDILNRLVVYTNEHFQREEELMLSIDYSEYNSHKEQHKKLLARVADLQHELNRDRVQIALDTAELLRFWLTSHILSSDKRLADNIRASSVNSTV
jgi:hemerythrin-like metal-binding protein